MVRNTFMRSIQPELPSRDVHGKALFAIGDQMMVDGCRCLKENLDELRIESV
jgi:hypothetical protein